MATVSLRKTVEFYRKQLGSITDTRTNQLEQLKDLPFYDWNSNTTVNDSSLASESRSKSELSGTFNHAIGLPEKYGQPMPLFDYEQLLFDTIQTTKHLWVKKATGLGVTEFMLRYMAWLCFRDDNLKGTQMLVITGPREDLAIGLVERMKNLFRESLNVTFDTKETVIELNGVHIEAYPSNHLDSARGLQDVSFIFLDECDFFRRG